MSVPVYVGIGSNLGNREGNVEAALAALRARPELSNVRASSLYACAPWGGVPQPAFVNAVAEARTTLPPRAFLAALLDIEARLGRSRLPGALRWGPRIIDLDLLLYGDLILNDPDLTVPHPRMTERRFVLAPLAELSPGVRHPVLARSAAELLKGVLDDCAVRRIEPAGEVARV